MSVAPRRIFNPDTQHLSLEWADGSVQTVNFIDLRFECPCAYCVDEKTGKRLIRRGQIKPDIRPAKIAPVGNYGVRIEWSDLHNTGVYAYETLRKIGARTSA
jgi:DUF971 family protein